jgi:hypothetical protein
MNAWTDQGSTDRWSAQAGNLLTSKLQNLTIVASMAAAQNHLHPTAETREFRQLGLTKTAPVSSAKGS